MKTYSNAPSRYKERSGNGKASRLSLQRAMWSPVPDGFHLLSEATTSLVFLPCAGTGAVPAFQQFPPVRTDWRVQM